MAGDNGFYFTHAAIAQLKMNKKLRVTTPNSINFYPFHLYIYIYLTGFAKHGYGNFSYTPAEFCSGACWWWFFFFIVTFYLFNLYWIHCSR